MILHWFLFLIRHKLTAFLVLNGQISVLVHYFNVLYVQKALLFVQKTKTKQKRIKSKRLRVVIRIIMSKKSKDMC